MGQLSVQEQIMLAHENERLAAKRRWYQINEWGLVNALASHFSLTNASTSKLSTGGQPALPLVPFGGTTTNVDNSKQGLGALGLLGLVGLAGLGGVGAASLAGAFDKTPPPPPPPVVEKVVEDAEHEIFIDWEMVPDDAQGN